MTSLLTFCLRVPGRRFRLSAEGGLSDGPDGLSFLCILCSYLLYYIWVDHCSACLSYQEFAGPCELVVIDISVWPTESYRFRRLRGPAKS